MVCSVAEVTLSVGCGVGGDVLGQHVPVGGDVLEHGMGDGRFTMLAPPAVPTLPTATRFVSRAGRMFHDVNASVNSSFRGRSVDTLRIPTAIQWKSAAGSLRNSTRNCEKAASRMRPWFIDRSKSPCDSDLRVREYSSVSAPVIVVRPSVKSVPSYPSKEYGTSIRRPPSASKIRVIPSKPVST